MSIKTMGLGRAYMVAGADGMIGGALAKSLRTSSERIVLTGLWQDGLSQDKIHLNLASDPSEWELPDSIKTVYICSGITKLEECRKDPTGSSRVNVEGTIRFAETMINKGAFVVFLSSNHVFDGTIANVPAHQPQNPKNEYGRQKTAVEKYLSKWPKQAAIVRLTKVIGPNSIFSRWAKSLRKDQPISPFTDMVVSPIPLITVVSILKLIGDQQLGGIWQVSGEQDINYLEAAHAIARALGANNDLIKPSNTVKAGLDIETNPVNTSMDTKRLRQELGLVPLPVYCIINQASSETLNEKKIEFKTKTGSLSDVFKEI